VLESTEYASGTLIDIGCGNKPHYPVFSSRVEKYIGMDLPYTPSHGSAVDIYADALNLPFKSNVIDTILCTEVLEHIVEPGKCLEELPLKPGGYMKSLMTIIAILSMD
jgi:predicted SAM-dependent methyltransferase